MARMQDNIREGNEAANWYSVRLLKKVVEPIAQRIRDEIASHSAGKAGRRMSALQLLSGIDPVVAAYVTARVVLQRLISGAPLKAVASDVSDALQRELMMTHFEAENPGLYAHLLRAYSSSGSAHKATVIRRSYLRHVNNPLSRWPSQEGVHLGVKLIHLMIEETGVVEVTYVAEHKNRLRESASTGKSGAAKTVAILTPTSEVLDWIEDTKGAAAALSPPMLPMVVPPVAWTSVNDGGYLCPRPNGGLLRSPKAAVVRQFGRLRDTMPDVYRAVNAAQSTAWRINPRILEVALSIWHTKAAAAGLSSGEEIPLPPSPTRNKSLRKEDMTPEEREAFRAWKLVARDIYAANRRSGGRRIGTAQTLSVAQTFAKYPAIWFPHNYDFRGRLYSIPTGLSPQGSDLSKGLLEFAEGKPIGDGMGPGWLAVHGANSFGNDKVSHDERIDWVEQNTDNILRSAEDPLGFQWWHDADSPFCFLAFCMEWAGFLRDGADHVTHLPVALDGSCSGIQHYTAALLDPEAAAAVNLVPAERPSDIYTMVAGKATELLTVRSLSGAEDGRRAADAVLRLGLDRGATKRPTMTLPYGSTRPTCGEYVEQWMLEKAAKLPPAENPIRGIEKEAARVCSAAVWDAIGHVVHSSREAMAWLRSCANAATKAGLPLRWTAPDGFWVEQLYRDLSTRRVKTRMGERLIYLSHAEETDKIDRVRQANGFPPNWVHSMDAAHLRSVACAAPLNGINSLALVHDSFGALACDVQVLSAILRVELVELYSAAPFEALRDQLRGYLPASATIPEPPQRGNLDLTLILQSAYAFS